MNETALKSDTSPKAHPITNTYPMMNDIAFGLLRQSIKEHGLISPIVMLDRSVLDGRNRLKACLELGIEPDIVDYNGDRSPEAIAGFVRSTNERRDMTPEQRAAVLLLQEEWLAEQKAIAKTRQHENAPKKGQQGFQQSMVTQKIGGPLKKKHAGETTQKIAEQAGTNRQYVSYLNILKNTRPEMFDQVREGKLRLVQARRQITEEKREQARRDNQQKVSRVQEPHELIGGKLFSTIVIDPPWDFKDENDRDMFGRAKPEYHTMPLEEMAKLRIGDLAAPDCHLYLWVTNRSLPKGFVLLENWGFRYITCLTWVKPSFGMGNYFRGQSEQVLFAVKGSQLLLRNDVGTVFQAPRGIGHSAKPEEFYQLVESCSPSPYIDLFSRRSAQNWMSWGEQAE